MIQIATLQDYIVDIHTWLPDYFYSKFIREILNRLTGVSHTLPFLHSFSHFFHLQSCYVMRSLVTLHIGLNLPLSSFIPLLSLPSFPPTHPPLVLPPPSHPTPLHPPPSCPPYPLSDPLLLSPPPYSQVAM